ncbi:MAG TPA: hypothetical protein VG455_01645 [Acidimicrobiales bacterium]|nr:hypothetical protein [Acidimicrobiales bacterium]
MRQQGDSASRILPVRKYVEGGLLLLIAERPGHGPVRRRYRITRYGLMRLRARVGAADASACDPASLVARRRRLELSSSPSAER